MKFRVKPYLFFLVVLVYKAVEEKKAKPMLY